MVTGVKSFIGLIPELQRGGRGEEGRLGEDGEPRADGELAWPLNGCCARSC